MYNIVKSIDPPLYSGTKKKKKNKKRVSYYTTMTGRRGIGKKNIK